MNQDFLDLLRAFAAVDVRFLVSAPTRSDCTGGREPRATWTWWINATPDNARCVMRALDAFGAPMTHITEADFACPGITYQIGLPPRRIDILTELTGLTFAEAWPGRVRASFGGESVDFIGRADFIRNKRQTGRLKDLADIEGLE